MTDQIVEATAAVLLLAHIIALAWTGLRKAIAPVLALNAIVSAGVVVYWAPRIAELLKDLDVMLAFVGFETFVLATSLFALRVRVPRTLVWLEFAVHALLIVAALAFMVMFKMNRLI